jgi:hypothetical protein
MTVDWTHIVMVVARSPVTVDSISTMVVSNMAGVVSMAVVVITVTFNMASHAVVVVANSLRTLMVMVSMRGSSSLIVRARSIGRPVSILATMTLESSIAIVGNVSAPPNFLEALEVDVL